MAWRRMKRNHSTALPRHIIFLDTETNKEPSPHSDLEFTNYLMCGYFVSVEYVNGKARNRDVVKFDDSRVFWNWLDAKLSKQYTTWLVAHKISFDWAVLGGWGKIDTGEYTIDQPRGKRPVQDAEQIDIAKHRGLCVIDDPPFILGLRHKNGGRLVAVDTLNWFRSPLKVIGDDIGLPKLSMPSKGSPVWRWEFYCKRDVEIVEKAFCGLIDFCNQNDCGMFRYTAPSQAMSAFRHSHMKHDIILHDEIEVKKLERRSYIGGDVRMFFRGEVRESLTQLDVNGLYPYVMRNNLFPSKLEAQIIDENNRTPCESDMLDGVIADVSLRTTDRSYPVRTEHGIIHCTGLIRTTLAGPELVAAHQAGDIITMHSRACYRLEPLFTDFIDYFHGLRLKYREQNNGTYEMLCKTMLNSLYGKFGQKSFKWQHRPDLIPSDEWCTFQQWDMQTMSLILYRSIGKHVFQAKAPEEHPQSFPAVASYVTACGREYMRELRRIAGDTAVYYQGVDSLVVNSWGLANLNNAGLLHPTKLGMLKIQHSCNYADFRGPNNYTLGDKVIRAGLQGNAVVVGPGQWWQEKFENADCQVNHKPIEAVKSWQTIFTDALSAEKRSIGKHGWTKPIHIDMLSRSDNCGQSAKQASIA